MALLEHCDPVVLFYYNKKKKTNNFSCGVPSLFNMRHKNVKRFRTFIIDIQYPLLLHFHIVVSHKRIKSIKQNLLWILFLKEMDVFSS